MIPMIRSTVLPAVRSAYPIVARTLPKAMAAVGMRPFGVFLTDKMMQRSLWTARTKTVATPVVVRPFAAQQRSFATVPRTSQEEDLFNKSFSDAFDDSDALEIGKNKKEVDNKQVNQRDNDTGVHSPLSKMLYDTHFKDLDDFFFSSRDPFLPFFTRYPVASSFTKKDPFFAPLFRHPIDDPWTSRVSPHGYSATIFRSAAFPTIKESKDVYHITVDVPKGLNAADMNVQVENNQVVISGQFERTQKDTTSSTRFEKRFTALADMNVDQLTANRSDDGVLELEVPKVPTAKETTPKRTTIPITTKDKTLPSVEEISQKGYSDAFDESDWAETGKE
jgi:HSP20 family molecular chaperone IbpA